MTRNEFTILSNRPMLRTTRIHHIHQISLQREMHSRHHEICLERHEMSSPHHQKCLEQREMSSPHQISLQQEREMQFTTCH